MDDERALHEAIEHARHLLPAQAPIRTFVHHNTLHALEHLPFDEAVVRGAEIFGAEPYEPEEAFAEHLANGRIEAEDIEAVMSDEVVGNDPLFPGGPTERELRTLRLRHPLPHVEGPALNWLLSDGGALSHFYDAVGPEARRRILSSVPEPSSRKARERAAVTALWECLSPHAPPRPPRARGPRPRDRVLGLHGVDVDEWTHPLLFRLCAAFIDQGIAYWGMPFRDTGFLSAFRSLYGRRGGPPDLFLRGLAPQLREDERLGVGAEETAMRALRAMGVSVARWGAVVEATLLSAPGWAGMMARLEERPDQAPVAAPPARLVDYLAVALTLEAAAVHHVTFEHAEHEGDEDNLDHAVRTSTAASDTGVVYEAFVLAQLAGIGPALLREPAARALIEEVRRFDSHARRRLWHLAYENHHRTRVLDAMIAHERHGIAKRPAPTVQAMFCIDEREESLRRHLEELDPTIETEGYAGFFGVPMFYRGLADVKATPLCPVVIEPKHLVVEEAIESSAERWSGRRRRAVGKLRHASHVGSRTFVRGGTLAATVGLAAVVPLVARVLFPRLAERFSHGLEHVAVGAPKTRLRLERPEGQDAKTADGLLPGFTVSEMARIVGGALETTGLAPRLAPLVIVVGHGSSSLNNPHESAHDCGATGGGRGGPNARAFVAMANHLGVRARLAERGTPIPEGTYFVGGYHNTCDDAIDWYDLDLVPDAHTDELARVRDLFEVARRRDAHERCRRFESAPTTMGPERALAHVEGRAVNLGEPRPEYGHATNAVCIVGRRERTRGLFFDRRAFLVSYDPTTDPEGEILGPLLAAVLPVGAGINLEYYFSFVDRERYGCGTKLPHNIVGLVGVMNGHASDLRTGLPWQMVEIHEPVRLLTIVEAEPEVLERLLPRHPAVAEVVQNQWIQLVAVSQTMGTYSVFTPNGFVPYEPGQLQIDTVETSVDHYRGQRGHLGCVRTRAALRVEAES